MQLKEQLAVQAVVVGIEDFECDFVFCGMDKLEEGLSGVKLSDCRKEKVAQAAAAGAAEAAARTTASCSQSASACVAISKSHIVGDESAAKRLRPAASLNITSRAPGDAAGSLADVVDVLVISSIVKLQDYSDVALAGVGVSPRGAFLQVRLRAGNGLARVGWLGRVGSGCGREGTREDAMREACRTGHKGA